jgi:hypothetical protein
MKRGNGREDRIWLVRVHSEPNHLTPAPRMDREASSEIEHECAYCQLD